MILVSEIGDKTFFIAAILAMQGLHFFISSTKHVGSCFGAASQNVVKTLQRFSLVESGSASKEILYIHKVSVDSVRNSFPKLRISALLHISGSVSPIFFRSGFNLKILFNSV